jgi:hypothetical protein
MLFSRADVERAKAIFVAVFTWLSGYQYERGIRKLLPDNEILGRNGEPTESEHVPAGLCGPCGQFPMADNSLPAAFPTRQAAAIPGRSVLACFDPQWPNLKSVVA